MKKILITLAAVLLTVGAEANTGKVGFIDMQKAIQATKEGQKAKKELETEFNKRKETLKKKEGDLRKMAEDLEKKSMVLSEEVKAQKQREFQESMGEFQKTVQKNQQEIQEREQKLTEPILDKMKKVIATIASKEGYTMILLKKEDNVLWATADADLTDRVVKEYSK